jgi:hypothetical protein
MQFGDLFAASHLFDAYLRSDAVQMGAKPAHPALGNGIAYSSLILGGDRTFVLAHGLPCDAVLVSDDCAIDEALGVGRQGRKQGRLLFAALKQATASEVQALVDLPSFDRFPLPQRGTVGPAVAELKQLFMVDIRDVDPATRTATLAESMASELAVHLAAFASRRGPLAALKNAEKLGHFLAGGTDQEVSPDIERATLLLAQVIAEGWTLEGGPLEDAGNALDLRADRVATLQALVTGLRALQAVTGTAIAELEHLPTG